MGDRKRKAGNGQWARWALWARGGNSRKSGSWEEPKSGGGKAWCVKQGAWGKSFKNHRRVAENAKIIIDHSLPSHRWFSTGSLNKYIRLWDLGSFNRRFSDKRFLLSGAQNIKT
jgi:hypothetical protein